MTIIGQIEGHMILPPQIRQLNMSMFLPQLTAIEQSEEIEGLLLILNTVGGDVEAGLAIAKWLALCLNHRFLWSWEAVIV